MIDWPGYYQKEAELSDFHPDRDKFEIHRCLAAWSVFPRKSIDSILDVGCGDGFFCDWIAREAGARRVAGADVSLPRLARARSRFPGLEFVEGKIPNLPFGDGEFQIVTCIEVLEHQLEPVAALRELARISSNHVLVTVPDRESVRMTLCFYCLKTFPAEGHLHCFDSVSLGRAFEEAGLKVTRIRSYYPAPCAFRSAVLRWPAGLYAKSRRCLLKLLRPQMRAKLLACLATK